MLDSVERIAVRCSGCGARLGVRPDAAQAHVKCPRCSHVVRVADAAGEEHVQNEESSQIETAARQDCPWVPSQILFASWLFGPLACGAIAGINFARMGNRRFLLPCVAIGTALFLAMVFVLEAYVAPANIRLVAGAMNLAIGLGFMLAQQPYFEEWKEESWKPAEPGGRYKPNRIGLMFLVALSCVAIQFGVIVLLTGLVG